MLLDVHLLREDIDTIKRNTEALLHADSLEVNAEKTEYVLMSHHQNADKNAPVFFAVGTCLLSRCLTVE
jgi:hypothetical protein